MNEKLTKKQKGVLTFIKKYIVQYGFPPSVREICAGLGLSSPATVHTHLKQLELKGAISKTKSKFRVCKDADFVNECIVELVEDRLTVYYK